MSETATTVGGIRWTIGAPGTEERITLRYGGKEWPVMATKAESVKMACWLYDYQVREWNPRFRPFERSWRLALNDRGKVIARAPSQDELLWSLATGRSWEELPQCWSTASDGPDEQPRPQSQQPQPARTYRDTPTPQAPRQSMGQRIVKALGLIKDDGTGTHGEQ